MPCCSLCNKNNTIQVPFVASGQRPAYTINVCWSCLVLPTTILFPSQNFCTKCKFTYGHHTEEQILACILLHWFQTKQE